MELLLMIDAAKASARHITAVTLFGWQDKIEKTNQEFQLEQTSSKLLETAGATRVMTMDLHADQIQGFLKTSRSFVASTIFYCM
jgi:ribose-phosphate pyrophosphokinase